MYASFMVIPSIGNPSHHQGQIFCQEYFGKIISSESQWQDRTVRQDGLRILKCHYIFHSYALETNALH